MLEDVTESGSTPDDLPKPPSGRRSSTRPAGPPQPVTFNDGKSAASEAQPAEQAAPSDEGSAAQPAASEDAHATASVAEKRPSRRRKATPKPEVSAESSDGEPASDVDAALEVARRDASRRGRRSRGTNAEMFGAGDQNRDAKLESLAAAIASGLNGAAEQPEATEAEEEEPTAEADTETTSDEAEVEDQAESEGEQPEASEDEESSEEPSEAAEGSDEEDSDKSGEQDDEAESGESGTPRRRRRRGGRRRRRSGGNGGEQADEAAKPQDQNADAEASDDQDDDHSASEEGSDDAEESTGNGGRRRRRRRRRRGEDTGGSDDDPSDVVVRVREPRSARAVADEVTGIEGSTRMEAKRQRRREGRAAGRRRAPILSEAEFLARRESVDRKMVIRQREAYTQLAVLEDGVLVEHYVDRASSASLIGNIYLGRVQNVLPSMEAAFIDIGRGRNAVLYAGEIDWDSYDVQGSGRKVEEVLKSGQSVLVQVTKDPVGAKGARLTGHISLPGRYVVYSPDGHLSGISRKLPDTERNRLKDILHEVVGSEASVIVRTAAEGAGEAELIRDVERLKAQWDVISKKKSGSAPQQLYAEPDLTLRIVRDLFTEDFSELVVAGTGEADDAYDSIKAYVDHIAPHLSERMHRWDAEQGDPFSQYRIDEQVSKALERKVFLPSGGSLVIDRTEAMTVIDVNTGKFTGTGGNLEETVTKNNLEAAEEIVRQLRLRDLGGIVMIDFIDMVLPANRELLLRRLVECLGRDRTRHQVSEVTSLGLVQMTRKKIGTGLAEAFTVQCDCCGGRGYIRHDEPVDSQAPADGGERKGRRNGRK